MAVPLTIRQRLRRKVPRVLKFTRQWARAAVSGRPDTRLVFVVGSQRSGTRLPIQALDCSPEIATYPEGSAPYFDDVLLRPLEQIDRLVERSLFPVVALKPICETHRVLELLARYPGSKAIWIFRNYERAVNSASIKWKSGREAVRRLAAGELKAAGWRAGGLTEEKLQLVTRLYHADMSLHAANAIMWYLRNSLFFDLGAATHPDVLLVRYEDLVSDPAAGFVRMFEFIDVPCPRDVHTAVRGGSNRSETFPPIDPEIRSLCDELHRRLESYHRAVLHPSGGMFDGRLGRHALEGAAAD